MMKNNKKILIGIGILAVIAIVGISLFTLNEPRNERCSWKVTEEDREKYADLGPEWSMIAGFEFDEERGCIPVGGFKYVEDVVPFKTKDECESACKSTPLAESVAKEHLQKYVHNAFPNVDFFSMVKKVEVVEDECEANHYWENWGKEPIKSPSKHSCWIVKFYYPGPAEGSHLVVYVDKNTNEVIGGTQTK